MKSQSAAFAAPHRPYQRARKTVRGQYTAALCRAKVPGYPEEEGANKASNTETFVSIRVDIDNWRWAGVPFYLRTGKRLPTVF